jgi:hypothetical protein
MSTTPNNALQAVARARSHTTWPADLCLRHVWDCYTGQPDGSHVKTYGVNDALAAWGRTTARRFDRTPPAGLPVYWRSSRQPHGHAALSVGGGRVRSTDWPIKGRVSEVAMSELERAWGLTYLGYGLDFCGDTVALPPPAPKPAAVLRRGSTGAAVRKLQAELLRVFPAYAGRIRAGGGPNGLFGPATEAVVREFQRRVGLTVTGVVDATTRGRLEHYGVQL